ncbi:glutaredoxin-1 [Narcine bancroftii]|uniref:glutaredoxin-1 n=1 Tax=Narcine bancroftii TaxID=1343680 RepID=UPI0038314003
MAREYVEAKIQAEKVVVFVKEACPYCTLAKSVLEKYDWKPDRLEIHDITGHPDMREIQDYFRSKTGASTVPRVFIGTECVGGGSDVQQLNDHGLLKDKLTAIGVLSS